MQQMQTDGTSAYGWSRHTLWQFAGPNAAAAAAAAQTQSFQAGDLISGRANGPSAPPGLLALKRLRPEAFVSDPGPQHHMELALQRQQGGVHTQSQKKLRRPEQQLKNRTMESLATNPMTTTDVGSSSSCTGISLAAARGILLLSDDSAQQVSCLSTQSALLSTGGLVLSDTKPGRMNLSNLM